jgi:hypothetical protein
MKAPYLKIVAGTAFAGHSASPAVEREAAASPATVTQLSRPRGGLLDPELQRALDGLDEAGKQFMNGYMRALFDQRGLQ